MIKKNIFNQLRAMAFAAVCSAALLPAATSCSSLEDDDHYKNGSSQINNPELRIVNSTSQEYISSREDLKQMHALFEKENIYKELADKGQLSTMLVVTDDHFKTPEGTAEEQQKVVRSHVSDISVSPANLHHGDRLMMWHKKYVNVSMDEQGQEGQIVDHISFNNGVVKEVIQTRNGYIYVISDMINTPTSLRDYIDNLGEEYSQFKALVEASGGKVFDRANSRPNGVNAEGNTTYDTVWIYTNTHFENVGMDLNSESLTATLLLPSNSVIDAAMADARQRLKSWNMKRDEKVLRNWILDASFFGRRLTIDEVGAVESADVNSVFGKQWRPAAHKLVADASEQLSNGVVHKVEKLHIPNNVLMYRLKDWFYLYENCTDEQKNEYFKMSNMTFKNCSTDVGLWSPLEGVWPQIQDRCLNLAVGEDGQGSSFRLDFTPVKLVTDEEGLQKVVPYTIPPGSYRLSFGSKQNQNLDIKVSVVVNGQVIATSPVINLGSATTYHYDRGATLPNRYPEGYNPSDVTAMGGSSKAGNYDTDGGPLIDEVVIPDLDGKGTAVPIVLRIESESWKEQTSFTLAHWCLRPTVNNY